MSKKGKKSGGKRTAVEPESAASTQPPPPIAALDINEDGGWTSFPVLLHTSQPYSTKYVEQALAAARKGRRRHFHVATRADIEQLVKEAGKAKGKGKDPGQAAIAEACSHALENGVLTARGAALIVATKMLAAKKAEMEKRQQEEAAKQAALSTPKAEESGSRSKTPKSSKKKGKGGAAAEDAPGKKKSALKSRKEEAAMIDYIDDEPSDGPDQYWLLHGFSDPDFISHMCDAGACIRALVDTSTEDDEDDEEEQEQQQQQQQQEEQGGETVEKRDDVETTNNDTKTEASAKGGESEAAAKQPDTFVDRVRALCSKADRTSQLHDIAWLSLDIGRAPPAEESFSRIANLSYDVLARHRQYKKYLASLHTCPLPSPTPKESVPRNVYNALLSAVDAETAPVAVLMDGMLRQVEATVAASAPDTRVQSAAPDGRGGSGVEAQTAPSTARTRTASAMTSTEERYDADPALAGFLDARLQGVRTIDAAIGGDTSVMEDSLMLTTGAAGADSHAAQSPLVLRYGDRLAAALASAHSSRYNAHAAALSVLEASQAAQLLHGRFPDLTSAAADAKKLKRQQLLKFSSSSPPQMERFVLLSAMQAMLSHATATAEDAWDLSAWNVTERLHRACLLQHLNADMQQHLLHPTLHYFDDMDCLLVAMHRIPDPETAGATTDAWEHLTHTKVGFTDFLEHTAQWLASHETQSDRASAGTNRSMPHADAPEGDQPQHGHKQQQEQVEQGEQGPVRVGYDYPRKLLRLSGRTDVLEDGRGTVVRVCETNAVHGATARSWTLCNNDVGVTLHEHARPTRSTDATNLATVTATPAAAPSAEVVDAPAPDASDTAASANGAGGTGDTKDGTDTEVAGPGHSLVLTVGETVVCVSERVVEALRTRGRSEWTPPPPATATTDTEGQDQQTQDTSSLAAVPENARPESSVSERGRKKGERPRSRREGAGSTAKSVRIRQPEAQQPDAAASATSPSNDNGSGGAGTDATSDEATAAAEAARKAREFQPQPLESLFTLSVGTAGGIQLALLPTGEVVMLNPAPEDGRDASRTEAGGSDASEREVSRTLMPGGYVARHMVDGRVVLLCPDGTTFDNVASETEWDAVRFDGTRTRVRGNPPAMQSQEDVLVVRRVSVPERVAVQTREDNATLVGELDRDHAVEYGDGTRIVTRWVSSTEKLVRVERMGHPPVELRDNGASVIVLENGASALVHHAAAGTLQVCSPRRGVDVLLGAAGEGALRLAVPSQLNSDGRGVYDAVARWEQHATTSAAAAAAAAAGRGGVGATTSGTHTFNFITGEYEGTDALGSALRVRDMEATVDASDTALLAPLSARFPPRLYVVHRDGTGVRFLREADVAAYDQAASAAADVRCVETELYEDAGTISKTYIKREKAQNKFLAHYEESSLLPVSLQRARLPHHDYDRREQLLLVRQLQFHANVGPQEQTAMQRDLDQYNEWLAKQDAAAEALHVRDMRSTQEKATADALTEDLLQQLTAMDDEGVSEGCKTLTTPPPKPVAQTTGRATLDEFFAEDEAASGNITEMKAMLQSRTIPDYFASPEAATVRQRLEAHAAELHRAAADADGGGRRRLGPAVRKQQQQQQRGWAASDEGGPRAGGVQGAEDNRGKVGPRGESEAAAASHSDSIDELASQRESMEMESPEPVSPSKLYAFSLEADDAAVPERSASDKSGEAERPAVIATVHAASHSQAEEPSGQAQGGEGVRAVDAEDAEMPAVLRSTLPKDDAESSPDTAGDASSPPPPTQGPLSPSLPINAVAQKTRAFDFLRDRGSDQPQVVQATPSALTEANADNTAVPEEQQQQQQQPAHTQREVETRESPQPLVGRRASTGSSRPGSGRALPEVRVRSAQTLRSNVPRELREAQQRPALAEVVPPSLVRPDPLPSIGQQGQHAQAPAHTSQVSPSSLMKPHVEAVPAKAEFGTLKGGCTYCLVVKLYNRGTAPCAVEVQPAPVDSGIDVTCLADKISPGMSVKVTLHVDTARALGPRAQRELHENIAIVCDGTTVVLPVVGTVLSLKDFEAQKATSRSRGPGVRLVAARSARA